MNSANSFTNKSATPRANTLGFVWDLIKGPIIILTILTRSLINLREQGCPGNAVILRVVIQGLYIRSLTLRKK